MKKFITLTIVLFSTTFVIGQNDFQGNYRSNSLKISPGEFTRAEFQIAYERYFKNRNSSISIMPSIILKDTHDENIEGYQVMGQYRFYLTHLNAENKRNFFGLYNLGFYTGVYGLFQKYNGEFIKGDWDNITQEYIAKDYEKNIRAYEGGALIGLQIDITRRIVIDFYLGGGIRKTDYTNTYEEESEYALQYGIFEPEYTGVKPKLGFLVGFTF